MIQLSTELYDQIVSQFEFSIRDEVKYTDQGIQLLQRFAAEGRGISDTQTLCNLRLTSRPFHQAATRILFRSTGVTWGPQSSSLDRFILAGGNSIPIVSNIRRVRFDFGDDMEDIFIQSSDGNKNMSNPTRWLVDKLPRLLSHLTQMSSFEFLSRGYRSDFNGSEGSAPKLDLELWQTMNYKIVEGLTSANFDALTDLRLSLPCTYDFVGVSKALPEDMCNRLKVLYLDITDATGPGGSKDYLRWADEETDGDEDFPLSNLQKWHPNVDREIDSESELDPESESDSDGHEERFKPTVNNESGVFDLVSRCPNLETLGLASTHVLNGNLLSWNPASQGLKYVYLLRIKISAENLVKLLSPAEHLTSSFSTASRLWFEDIELTAGS